VQDDSELPFWIRDLLSRRWYSCSEPAYVHFRQGLLREWVMEAVDGHENGSEQSSLCLATQTRPFARLLGPVCSRFDGDLQMTEIEENCRAWLPNEQE
jgi:hypothetical protein